MSIGYQVTHEKPGVAERYNLYSQTSVMVTHILSGPTSVSIPDHLHRSMQDPLLLSFFNHNQSNGSRECLSSPQPTVFIIFYIRFVFKFRLPPLFERYSSIGESHPFLPKYHLYQITDWRFSISITSWAKLMLIPYLLTPLSRVLLEKLTSKLCS